MLAGMLERLSQRDRATARHSAAVARYARDLCRANGGDERTQQLVHRAGLLHDVGKVHFPDHIFEGGRRLTGEDWETIRRHPAQGAEMILRVPGQAEVAEIVLSHHERVDSRGYPHGLARGSIPLLSRMLSIVDAYDVMTSRDSYRRPTSHAAAVAELRRASGTQLDPSLVRSFVAMLDRQRRAYPARELGVGIEGRAIGSTPGAERAIPVVSASALAIVEA